MEKTVSTMLKNYHVSEAAHAFISRQHGFFIDNIFTAEDRKERLNQIEPSTGGFLSSMPAGNIKDIDAAVEAARRSFDNGWGQLTPAERERIMNRMADLIEEHADILAEIETINNGKAIEACKIMDIAGSAEVLRYFAGWATKIHGDTRSVSTEFPHWAMTIKEPIGVVGAIVPWNWPLNMAMWKLAAALATGCTMVIKPAEATPLSLLYFCELCVKAGMPPGTLNVVTGEGKVVGRYLAAHSGINKLSFTGSTDVGRAVYKEASQSLIPATMELGGKSPMLVFEDADFDAVAMAARYSIFLCAGQVCSAGSRLLVERKALPKMLSVLKEMVDGFKVCPGLDPECDIGPVISESAMHRIHKYIETGLEEGCELIAGGVSQSEHGFFVQPTILLANNDGMTVVQEEIFGPVLVIVPFDEEEEGIKSANNSQYGLGASVWTKDITRALNIVKRLESGTVWVNTHDAADPAMPFGGCKNSGFGKDLGPEQLDHYLKTKAVWVAL